MLRRAMTSFSAVDRRVPPRTLERKMKMSFNLRALTLAAIAASLVGSATAVAETKIGYVDLQKALTLTDEGKAAKDRLKRDFDVKQKKLDAAQEDLKKERDTYDKQNQLWTEDKRREKQMDLERKIQEATKMWQEMQRDLSEAEQKETGSIFQKMEVIIHDIAESEGFTHVFDRGRGGLIYAPESMDLTAELVRKYNERYATTPAKKGAGGSTPAPKGNTSSK
jgi:outer membrane protein